jgi:hypothetical protein
MPIQNTNAAAGFSAYNMAASYTSNPNYGGDPGTYGNPYSNSGYSSQGMQQQFYAGIYMAMMQTQMQLQQGFSQFLGQNQYPSQQPPVHNCSCGKTPTPQYGTPAPQYGAPAQYGGGGYVAPAPAPQPPAKKGGYA